MSAALSSRPRTWRSSSAAAGAQGALTPPGSCICCHRTLGSPAAAPGSFSSNTTDTVLGAPPSAGAALVYDPRQTLRAAFRATGPPPAHAPGKGPCRALQLRGSAQANQQGRCDPLSPAVALRPSGAVSHGSSGPLAVAAVVAAAAAGNRKHRHRWHAQTSATTGAVSTHQASGG